ncbi:TrbI/VirB10 family protein [Vibrio sp. 10N.261.46.A3]|uniref:TrbI/VirB10 family protein n=1 Tax=Vibrio sp. 10N.261.46.A3 TaxID=3229658 RepID=UPI003550AE52
MKKPVKTGNIKPKMEKETIFYIGFFVLVCTVVLAVFIFLRQSERGQSGFNFGKVDDSKYQSTYTSHMFKEAELEEKKPQVKVIYRDRPVPKEKAEPIKASSAFLAEEKEEETKAVATSNAAPVKEEMSDFEKWQLVRLAQFRESGGDFESLQPTTISTSKPPFTEDEESKKEVEEEESPTKDEDSTKDDYKKTTTLDMSTPTTNKEKPHDKDFSVHGIGKNETTLPVDLTRTVTQDRYIPCILIDQINSQLAGQVTCQVENNIYGYHGRKILIPAGSRAIGKHSTIKAAGVERFAIEWTRLLRPDGVHILLKDSGTSDAIGQSGVSGFVDNRMFDKYGAAIITATMSTVMQVAMSKSYENSDITNSVVDNFGTDLGQVTAAMLSETVNIKPFAVVPSGSRIFIRPSTDIWLKETREGDLVFAEITSESSIN